MDLEVPQEFVDAAVRAAARSGRDVADVSVAEIARAAGVSRSTLLRRLGGTRAPLDEAVAAAGVELGGRAPVKERALEATAWLLDETDLASTTMEAIAARADCSVDALYAAFRTRDELLAATFERFSPLPAVEQWAAQPHEDLRSAAEGFYQRVVEGMNSRPRVEAAVAAQALGRGSDPAAQAVVRFGAPRIMAAFGGWLAGEVAAGRVRDLPLPLLLQQFGGPILFHVAINPVMSGVLGPDRAVSSEQAVRTLADNFLRAVATPAFWEQEAAQSESSSSSS
ncbi:TetR/AcrR family transcriptional regulator [Luteococcus peritonei]|uniref:TetR/AcrR family transcriptional regulator n=1 Tax=Luteococcus peritonei TaxID=88874 RepID=A0ABW4RXB4_9ACTN